MFYITNHLILIRKFNNLFTTRFSPALIVFLLVIFISFVTRLSLLIYPANHITFTFTNIAGLMVIGLFYDLCSAAYISIPFVLYVWLTNERFYQPAWRWVILAIYLLIIAVLIFTDIIPVAFNKDIPKVVISIFVIRAIIFFFLSSRSQSFRQKWRKYVLYFDFFLLIFILLLNACSEWFFWNEFSTRYNFIAVDYLIYTNEVLGNIRESYPIFWILGSIAVVSFFILLLIKRALRLSLNDHMSFAKRTLVACCFLLLPVATYLFVNNRGKEFSANTYVNELAGNGLFDFGTAYWSNKLDFLSFYKSLPDSEAFKIVRNQMTLPGNRFISNDLHNITRQIIYDKPEKKLNVVLISVESLSAAYMDSYGNTQHLTPRLDSLSKYSLTFTNLYASGTRTVRGLEALSLSIPPTPGESIIKRQGNEQLFSLGSIFAQKNYTVQFLYGGYGYFDNMNAFFGNNNYEVIDRNAIAEKDIHYQNIWGVADEDLFTLAINTMDKDVKKGKPFFAHIMTVSNHRPYTYPEGRIDISPKTKTREGAIKYTDYAIGKFIQDASHKAWFNNTVFVIVADHCASSAGSVDLPVTGYHIPLIIYSPAFVKPTVNNRLMAQIDIAPTILGLLKFTYLSKFFGFDMLALTAGKERVFISTYQGLGYLKDNSLVIQSPVKKITQFKPDFATGNALPEPLNDSLVKEAIANYQCANWLIEHKEYNVIKR
ncbi:MAG: sulfatase-like hydrolase/transferase [Ginsengibacter sp.]